MPEEREEKAVEAGVPFEGEGREKGAGSDSDVVTRDVPLARPHLQQAAQDFKQIC